MLGLPSLGGPSAANSSATSDLYSEQASDKSGLFQLGNITVATGRSSIAQSASASDGGPLSPWLIGGGILALAGFGWLLWKGQR